MEFSEKQLFRIFNDELVDSINVAKENESQFVAYINGKLFKTNRGKTVFDSEKTLITSIKLSDLFYNIKMNIYNKIASKEEHNDHEWHPLDKTYEREAKSITDYLFEQLIVAKIIVIKELSKDY